MKNHGQVVLASVIILSLASFCCSGRREAKPSSRKEVAAPGPGAQPLRLDSYAIKGFIFAYYLIPSGIGRDELIATAQALHDREPRAQLILVDDRTELDEYIHYAQEFSRGNTEAPFPKDWADQHVIANVQKYVSGKWMLCESYGYNEIAELK